MRAPVAHVAILGTYRRPASAGKEHAALAADLLSDDMQNTSEI
jgi:hypothetical protein